MTVKELDENGQATFTWNFLADPSKLPGEPTESPQTNPSVATSTPDLGLGFPESCQNIR